MNTRNDLCFYNTYTFIIHTYSNVRDKIFTINYNVENESNKTRRLKFNRGE
jgi:hypothetical protein